MKPPCKFHPSLRNGLLLAAIIFSSAAAPLPAADDPAKKPAESSDPRADGNKIINQAWSFYQTLQLKPETAVPDRVVAASKGVLIINRWSGAAGVGITGGSGIGLKRTSVGKFTAPAFYSLGGVSLGLQLGGSNVQTLAFLMTDKALVTLTDNKFIWSGNVRAIAGPNSSSQTTIDDKADVILYQLASGLDVGATVAGTEVSVDYVNNRQYYNNPSLTPQDIFLGKVDVPESARALVKALDQQAGKSDATPTVKR